MADISTAFSRRCGLQFVKEWIGKFPSQAAAARSIPVDGESMDPTHLRVWLHEPHRGLSPKVARAVALATGLPLEAILFKNERICDLACEKARRKAA